MPESPVVNNACDACGQEDDHPMVHVWIDWIDRSVKPPRVVEKPSFHHDCLPPEIERLYDDGHAPVASAAIAAAKDGTHGDDLRKLIHKAHRDAERSA